VIIGDEKLCIISTERLEKYRHRISVDAYEEFYHMFGGAIFSGRIRPPPSVS